MHHVPRVGPAMHRAGVDFHSSAKPPPTSKALRINGCKTSRARDERSEFVRRTSSATIEVAVRSAQGWSPSGASMPKSDPHAVDLDRIAIDHAGLADQIVSRRGRCERGREKNNDHEEEARLGPTKRPTCLHPSLRSIEFVGFLEPR